MLARFDGATTAKVKVAERGQRLEDDLDRVAAVRDVMGPDGRIRVDANGGWSVPEATDALSRLAAYGLEYAEQPCAEVGELRELRLALARAGIDVLVAADESIRKAEDPVRVAREEAADLVVVKVAPLGGVAPRPRGGGRVRAPRGGLVRPRHLGGHGRGGRARGGPARPAVRVRAGDRGPAGGRRHRWVAASRVQARSPSVGWTPTRTCSPAGARPRTVSPGGPSGSATSWAVLA